MITALISYAFERARSRWPRAFDGAWATAQVTAAIEATRLEDALQLTRGRDL